MILTISLILPFCSAGMLVAGSHLTNPWYLLTRTSPDFIHKFFTLHLSVFVHVSLHISLHLCPNRILALARNSSIIHAAAIQAQSSNLSYTMIPLLPFEGYLQNLHGLHSQQSSIFTFCLAFIPWCGHFSTRAIYLLCHVPTTQDPGRAHTLGSYLPGVSIQSLWTFV